MTVSAIEKMLVNAVADCADCTRNCGVAVDPELIALLGLSEASVNCYNETFTPLPVGKFCSSWETPYVQAVT